MAIGNKVLFEYRSNSGLPEYPDPDTIYFLESTKEIYVGAKVLANFSTGDVTTEALLDILEAYQIKSIIFQGSGNNVSDISFDSSIGRVTVTKSNLPVLAKGAATTPADDTLSPGDTFEAVTSTSVDGHTIYDGKTRFKLPEQITSATITKSTGNVINLTLISSDGSTDVVSFDGFGSAAFADTSDFATAAQGVLATNAMPANNGVATNAKITLLSDPVNNMDAATKQYVDIKTSGLGASSTITKFKLLSSGWTTWDTIHRYPDIYTTGENAYYQVNLSGDTSITNSVIAANADIHAKIESNKIVLYCFGPVPSVDLDLDIIEIPSVSGIALGYDIGEESCVTPVTFNTLESRVTQLETQVTNNLLYARNVVIISSRWSSSGDADYPYKATINMQGVDGTYFPVVEFENTDVDTYDLSPTATTGTNSVVIYCKTKPTTTLNIPIITCYRGTATTAS